MSDAPRFVCSPRPDATPEVERSALASVYRFVLACRERKEGGPATAPDARKEFNGSGKAIIQKQL